MGKISVENNTKHQPSNRSRRVRIKQLGGLGKALETRGATNVCAHAAGGTLRKRKVYILYLHTMCVLHLKSA